MIGKDWHESGGKGTGNEEVEDEIRDKKGGVVSVGGGIGAEVCSDEAVS